MLPLHGPPLLYDTAGARAPEKIVGKTLIRELIAQHRESIDGFKLL